MNYDEVFYKNQSAGSSNSAVFFLELLSGFYSFNSVIDFGCGVGTWLDAASKFGARRLVGYDGEWVDKRSLYNKDIDFFETNFEDFFEISEKFDLAISVEVAEHLSKGQAESFVATICNSADVVIFGAAIPGQGGTNHINEQPQSYWIDRFSENGFVCFDFFRSKFWQNENIEFWYRQNTFLFVNENLLGQVHPEIKKFDKFIADLVHPEMFKKISGKGLVSHEVDLLRDSAILLENIDIVKSLELMRIAQESRPDGRYIKRKIKEYEDKILR